MTDPYPWCKKSLLSNSCPRRREDLVESSCREGSLSERSKTWEQSVGTCTGHGGENIHGSFVDFGSCEVSVEGKLTQTIIIIIIIITTNTIFSVAT